MPIPGVRRREVNKIIDVRQQKEAARTGKILTHSAYLVCSLLMVWLEKSLNFSDIQTDITARISANSITIDDFLSEVVLRHESANANGYPQSFFKNQTKIEALETDLKRHLFQNAVA